MIGSPKVQFFLFKEKILCPKIFFVACRNGWTRYSMGFPATESGIEIKILKSLFSEADAALFLNLTPMLETSESVAARLELPVEKVAAHLEDMALRGLLFRLEKKGTVKYVRHPFCPRGV